MSAFATTLGSPRATSPTSPSWRPSFTRVGSSPGRAASRIWPISAARSGRPIRARCSRKASSSRPCSICAKGASTPICKTSSAPMCACPTRCSETSRPRSRPARRRRAACAISWGAKPSTIFQRSRARSVRAPNAACATRSRRCPTASTARRSISTARARKTCILKSRSRSGARRCFSIMPARRRKWGAPSTP